MQHPVISVLVPVYNAMPYLPQCLASLASQTLSNIEFICIDDGATDESPRILDEFAQNDSRFLVIHKQNGGYGKAINAALAHAQGDYIGIVEPDDYIDETMYEKLYKAAQHNNFPDIVKSAYWRVVNADTAEQEILPANYLHSVAKVNERFTLAEDAEFLFHHPSIWTAIYRREFLDEFKITMHEIPGAGWADNPWLIETLAQARSIVYIDECLYYYREFNVGSSSVVKDPSIIYDRWFDMDKIIKDLHITAPRIIEGHYSRGCAYIEMLDHGFDTNDPTIKRAIREMVKRIDYGTAVSSEKISPAYKAALHDYTSPVVRGLFRLKERFGLANNSAEKAN